MDKDELLARIKGSIRDEGELAGVYERQHGDRPTSCRVIAAAAKIYRHLSQTRKDDEKYLRDLAAAAMQ